MTSYVAAGLSVSISTPFVRRTAGTTDVTAAPNSCWGRMPRPKVALVQGMYYLCDNGYANGEGFLTPYHGVRYHLKEWDRGGGGPQNARELFNLRHAAARNVIERSFGQLKTRWGILRSHSYYSIDVQSRIVVACCLLHNYVRMEMPDDPFESEVQKSRITKMVRTWILSAPLKPHLLGPHGMNSNDQEGTSNPRRYRGKSDKTCTRRTWTQREEEALVNALRTICCTGWRCENGFRAGYLNQLEALFFKQFSGSDIRAEPHINSKIHVWKKYYSTLVSMMGKSGFGWDDSRCMITVDSQDMWDEYCKQDATARTMRFKLWPFFPAWRKIFGRDRAEGARIFETVHEYNPPSKSNVGQSDSQECYVPTAEWCPSTGYVGNDASLEDIQFTPEANAQSTAATRKSTSSSKRRKIVRETEDDGFSNAVTTFCQSANERLAEMSKKLFTDYIEGEKRAAVFEAVGEVPGIDMNDQILISDRLVENSKKMDLFFSLPAEARVRMVGMMLNGKM
ncbi:UNVERIFIED_CONTAM: hypothetical protein Sradi_2336700 [Sesamum radiatum]|uniref:Myb/SANT-like domain-containing protein n=1 Tax=Sesamum radiatum TaxID=300843 RepID=A0AAW2T673_SESRA